MYAKPGGVQGRAARTTVPERREPLETAARDRLERLLGEGLPEVTIHRGGRNQEALRGAGAVALTRGTDVYIREEEYREGFGLTEAILLHELTHVLQFAGREKLDAREDIEGAEKEAERAERLASSPSDGCLPVEINGRIFRLDRKAEEEAMEHALELLGRTVREAAARGDVDLLCRIERELEAGR